MAHLYLTFTMLIDRLRAPQLHVMYIAITTNRCTVMYSFVNKYEAIASPARQPPLLHISFSRQAKLINGGGHPNRLQTKDPVNGDLWRRLLRSPLLIPLTVPASVNPINRGGDPLMISRKPKKSKNLQLWRVEPTTCRSTPPCLYHCITHSFISIYNMLSFISIFRNLIFDVLATK